ncbi:hypothetical protein G9A89_021626 [Geosiphon pyriformis]|nr:hypothetical protein G9A89_021626 [Geosiphon pyriformis]
MVAGEIVLVCDLDGGSSEWGIADKSEVDILAVDRLVAASLAGNYSNIGLDFDLDNDSEFETSDRGFDIDFLIIGYLNAGDSQFGYVLGYHNSGRYAFPVVTIDWLMKMDMVDFGHD